MFITSKNFKNLENPKYIFSCVWKFGNINLVATTTKRAFSLRKVIENTVVSNQQIDFNLESKDYPIDLINFHIARSIAEIERDLKNEHNNQN